MEQSMGKRIAANRKRLGLTQDQMAERLGVTAQAVSKWENDLSCPDISLLPALCQALGVTSDELLTGKTNEVRLVPPAERKSLDELTLRVYVNSADGDRVRVNLPMRLVKVCMEMGLDVSGSVGGSDALKNLDVEKIVELAEQGAIGKLVEVETGDGDTVEVVVE